MPPRRSHTKEGALFSCFTLTSHAKPPKTRRAFEERRRKEVGTVRKRKACLRCKLLKLPCSGEDPCSTCLKVARSNHEKKVLGFSDCIRTVLRDVSIFENAIPKTSPEKRHVVDNSMLIGHTSITLAFFSHVTWDLAALTGDVSAWLNDSSDNSTSKVGTMSSPQFLQLVRHTIGPEAARSFQIMLYSESLSYTQPTSDDKHFLSVAEIQEVGAMAGHDFLLELDRRLSPMALAACSKEDLQTMFLLVFGTILAVGYTVPSTEYPTLPSREADNAPTSKMTLFEAMQEHLCRMLAHYLLYIGHKLQLQIPAETSTKLVDAAHKRWEKEGIFLWRSQREDESCSESEGSSSESGDPPLSSSSQQPVHVSCDPYPGASCFGAEERLLASVDWLTSGQAAQSVGCCYNRYQAIDGRMGSCLDRDDHFISRSRGEDVDVRFGGDCNVAGGLSMAAWPLDEFMAIDSGAGADNFVALNAFETTTSTPPESSNFARKTPLIDFDLPEMKLVDQEERRIATHQIRERSRCQDARPARPASQCRLDDHYRHQQKQKQQQEVTVHFFPEDHCEPTLPFINTAPPPLYQCSSKESFYEAADRAAGFGGVDPLEGKQHGESFTQLTYGEGRCQHDLDWSELGNLSVRLPAKQNLLV